LDAVQSNIDAQTALNNQINNATNAVLNAETLKSQPSVDSARSLINSLPNCVEKTNLSERLDIVQNYINLQDQINNATNAVVNAETLKSQNPVDSARTIVNALPDCTEKINLINRLNALQSYIDSQVALQTLVDTATNYVTSAEKTLTQSNINTARTLINNIPVGNSERTSLAARLDKVQNVVDAIEQAKTTKTQASKDYAISLLGSMTDIADVSTLEVLTGEVNNISFSDAPGTNTSESTGNLIITGTITATQVKFTVPTDTSFIINPNEGVVSNRFIAPNFMVSNECNAPLKLEIQELSNDTTSEHNFTDLLPGEISDWSKLNKTDSESKIALAIKSVNPNEYRTLAQNSNLYAKQVQQSAMPVLIGEINPNSSVTMGLEANHGLSFGAVLTTKYKVVYLFSLAQ